MHIISKKVSPKVWGARLMPYSAPPDRKHSLNPVDDQSRPGILRKVQYQNLVDSPDDKRCTALDLLMGRLGSRRLEYIYIYIYIYIAKCHREVLKLAQDL